MTHIDVQLAAIERAIHAPTPPPNQRPKSDKPVTPRRFFTPEEDAEILRMWQMRMTYTDIALATDRHQASIGTRLKMIRQMNPTARRNPK